MNTLYRLYNEDQILLYVGRTCDFGRRAKQHEIGKEWWGAVDHIILEHFDDFDQLCYAEGHAIREERPIFNLAGRHPDDVPHNIPRLPRPVPEYVPT